MRILAAAILALLALPGCEPDAPRQKPKPKPRPRPEVDEGPKKPVVQKSLLKRKLEREGHVFRDGKWFKKEAWTWGINNLWDVDKVPARMQDVSVRSYWDQVTHRSVLGAGPGFPAELSGIRQKWGDENLKFIAPAKGTGVAQFKVPIPPDLQWCKVKATGEIHWKDRAGYIRVSVECGGDQKELYVIEEGRNDVTYDVTDLVKGKSELVVMAEIREDTCIDKENNTGRTFEAHARFLPSVVKRSRDVLLVSGERLVPRPELDTQWTEAK